EDGGMRRQERDGWRGSATGESGKRTGCESCAGGACRTISPIQGGGISISADADRDGRGDSRREPDRTGHIDCHWARGGDSRAARRYGEERPALVARAKRGHCLGILGLPQGVGRRKTSQSSTGARQAPLRQGRNFLERLSDGGGCGEQGAG